MRRGPSWINTNRSLERITATQSSPRSSLAPKLYQINNKYINCRGEMGKQYDFQGFEVVGGLRGEANEVARELGVLVELNDGPRDHSEKIEAVETRVRLSVLLKYA